MTTSIDKPVINFVTSEDAAKMNDTIREISADINAANSELGEMNNRLNQLIIDAHHHKRLVDDCRNKLNIVSRKL